MEPGLYINNVVIEDMVPVGFTWKYCSTFDTIHYLKTIDHTPQIGIGISQEMLDQAIVPIFSLKEAMRSVDKEPRSERSE